MIKAITFDLWDTVFIDDSDEPKRKRAGRPTKSNERRLLVKQFVEKRQTISQEDVNRIYDQQDAEFKRVWHDQHITWTVRERLEKVIRGLNAALPEDEMAELVRLHEEMELEFRPDFVEGVQAAIQILYGKYKLAVISDAIFSPGRSLRKLLEGEDLLQYFSTFIFSDEIGCSKPDERIFKAAKDKLGVNYNEIVHIGDREHNDIIGPQKMGMRTILCLAALDRGSDKDRADGFFYKYDELPELIENMVDN